ncbi:MAG: TonB-dependent receptor [Microscillaceae bacterium]|nr:TonB-dependent receptor [Microscillaceae bacterium]
MRILLYLLIGLGTSQMVLSAQTLTLRDAQNEAPIVGATFQYGAQNGLSNKEGNITLTYKAGTVLSLSHVSYGQWQLAETEVKQALQAGYILREATSRVLSPITVIALRWPQDNAQTLVLTPQERLAHDGGALLHRTPGLSSIRKSGAYGFDPVLRGFKYDQLNVVVDGAQCATAACPNRMDPPTSQMAPNMMQRIEVLKGPYALRFGNSFGGTIHFISAPAQFSEASEVNGRLSGGWESNGQILRSEGQLGFRGQSYDLNLFASWAQGNDYQDGDAQAVPADFLRASFGATLGLKINPQQQIVLSATRNLARDADFPALPMDLRTDDTWLFQIKHDWQAQRAKFQSLNSQVFFTSVDHLMDNGLKALNPRMLNVETPAQTLSYGARLEGIWHFGVGKLFLGSDLRVEQAEGIRRREFLMGPNAGLVLFDNAWQNGQINRMGIFAEYQWNLGKGQLVAATRIERNEAQIKDADAAFTQVYATTNDTQINPSLSLGYTHALGNAWRLGIWAGRSQRSGSLTERFINYFPVGLDPFEILGNPALKPEVNNQFDLMLSLEKPKFQLNLDFFGAYMQNFITAFVNPALSPRIPSSPGVRQYANLGEVFKTGFEWQAKQSLTAFLEHHLSLAYTYARETESNAPLPEIAPLEVRYSILGRFWKGKFRPEVKFRHAITQSRVSAEFRESRTPGFSIWDISLHYQPLATLQFTGGVQNLFDIAYNEHLNRNVQGTQGAILAPGRNFFLNLSWAF